MSTSIQVKAPNNIEDSSLKKPSPPTPNLLSSVISSSKVLPKADLNDHQQTPTNVSQFELHGEKEITTSNYGVSDSRSSVTASNHEARKPLTPTNSQREQKVDETQVNTRSNKNNRNNEGKNQICRVHSIVNINSIVCSFQVQEMYHSSAKINI